MKITFIATLLFQTKINDSNYISYEQSILLLKEESDIKANEKALDYGKSQETSYLNNNKELVIISFIKIITLQETLRENFDENGFWELQSKTFFDINSYNKINE